jgi:hypothetical protein
MMGIAVVLKLYGSGDQYVAHVPCMTHRDRKKMALYFSRQNKICFFLNLNILGLLFVHFLAEVSS